MEGSRSFNRGADRVVAWASPVKIQQLTFLARLYRNYQARNKARFQLLVSKLHALGPYPFYHFIDEIERGANVRDHLELYASLPPGFIKAYGGDVFPLSVHVIVGEGAEG